MIVVVSHADDLHATTVIDELERRGEAPLLLDLAAFPHQATLTIDYRQLGPRLLYEADGGASGTAVDLGEARVVWWRRPQPFGVKSIDDADAMTFAYNEWQEAINGLWQLLPVHWVNHPVRDEVASRKALQLQVATDVGLLVPQTLMTTSPDAARAFITARAPKPTIFKTFSCTHETWRETRLIGDAELELLDQVRLAPVIFQEFIDDAIDVRVTVIGEEMFPVAIDSRQTDYPVDFRMSLGQADKSAIDLPSDVTKGLTALMERLGIVYGAIDLRMTESGDFVFLEINPAGEWLFAEQATGLPITDAMVSYLVSRDQIGLTTT